MAPQNFRPEPASADTSEMARILSEYHQLMRQFLQVQEHVMTAYLADPERRLDRQHNDLEFVPNGESLDFQPQVGASYNGEAISDPLQTGESRQPSAKEAQNDSSGAITMESPGSTTPETELALDGPVPGTIEDGYRFKGGDPARAENWEAV